MFVCLFVFDITVNNEPFFKLQTKFQGQQKMVIAVSTREKGFDSKGSSFRYIIPGPMCQVVTSHSVVALAANLCMGRNCG